MLPLWRRYMEKVEAGQVGAGREDGSLSTRLPLVPDATCRIPSWRDQRTGIIVAAVTSRPTAPGSDTSDRAETGRDHRLVLVVGSGAAMGQRRDLRRPDRRAPAPPDQIATTSGAPRPGLQADMVSGKGLDVVAHHLLGAVKVAGLGNSDIIDVQLPAVCPSCGHARYRCSLQPSFRRDRLRPETVSYARPPFSTAHRDAEGLGHSTADHNVLRQRDRNPADLADRGSDGLPGQRWVPTVWACLTSEGSFDSLRVVPWPLLILHS